MEAKELLLLYITITGFISYLPQIVRMLKRKSSDDVSISTWAVWTVNSSIYLLYLLLSTENIWLIVSQIAEVTLIAVTLIVILILRIGRGKR